MLLPVGFQYFHLHESDVRTEMLNAWHEEWADLSANWPQDQRPYALASKDDDWLVGEMSSAVCWMDKSPRKHPSHRLVGAGCYSTPATPSSVLTKAVGLARVCNRPVAEPCWLACDNKEQHDQD